MKSYVQIYGSPDDLQIIVGERRDMPGVFCMEICRGPLNDRHAFYPIVSTNENLRYTKEQAIEQLREVLKTAIQVGKDVVFGTHDRETDFAKGLLQVLFNNEKKPEDVYAAEVAPVLTETDIEKILLCVNRRGGALTFRWHNYWEKRFPGYREKFFPKKKAV